MSFSSNGRFSKLRSNKSKEASKPTKPTKTEAPGSRQVTPTTGAYAFEASQQTIQILQKFADALPVPCANQVLGLGLMILTTYEVGSRLILEGGVDANPVYLMNIQT